jgi:hypothetical protein
VLISPCAILTAVACYAVDSFIADVKEHAEPGANVQEVVFEKARHAMAVVENPQDYKAVHVNKLLAMVPGWRANMKSEQQAASSQQKTGAYEPRTDHEVISFA